MKRGTLSASLGMVVLAVLLTSGIAGLLHADTGTAIGTEAQPGLSNAQFTGDFGSVSVTVPEKLASRGLAKGSPALAGAVYDLSSEATLTIKVMDGATAASLVDSARKDYAKPDATGYRAFGYESDVETAGAKGARVFYRRADVALSEVQIQALEFTHSGKTYTLVIEFFGWKAGEGKSQPNSEVQTKTFAAWATSRNLVAKSFSDIKIGN